MKTKKLFISLLVAITVSLACNFSRQIVSPENQPIDEEAPSLSTPENLTVEQAEPSITWMSEINNVDPSFNYMMGIPLTVVSDTNDNVKSLEFTSYFLEDGYIYFSDENKYTAKINLSSGNKEWQTTIQGSLLEIGQDIALIHREDNRIYGVSMESGEEKWKVILELLVPENSSISPTPQAFYLNGEFVIPVSASCGYERGIQLLHIQEITGETRLTDCLDGDKTLVRINNIVVLQDTRDSSTSCTSGALNVFAVNADNGDIIWSVEKDQSGCFTTLEVDKKTGAIYLLGSSNWWNSDMLAIDIASGKHIWGEGLLAKNGLSDTKINYAFGTGITITNDYVFTETDSNELLVFNKGDGSLHKQFTQDRKFDYFVSNSQSLVISYPELGIAKGVDIQTGNDIWENDELHLPSFHLIAINDIIAFSDDDTDEVFALNQKTGEIIWKKYIDGYNESNPSYFAHYFSTYGDKVLYKDKDGARIIVLDPNTGDTFPLLTEIIFQSMSIHPLDENHWLIQGLGTIYMVNIRN